MAKSCLLLQWTFQVTQLLLLLVARTRSGDADFGDGHKCIFAHDKNVTARYTLVLHGAAKDGKVKLWGRRQL
jgi:hypothetical protein